MGTFSGKLRVPIFLLGNAIYLIEKAQFLANGNFEFSVSFKDFMLRLFSKLSKIQF